MTSKYFLATGLIPCIALAQHPHDPWMQCSLIRDAVARLACFDKVAQNNLPPKEPIATPIVAEKKAVDLNPEDSEETSISEQNDSVVITEEDLNAYSPLSRLYDLDQNDEAGILNIRPHQPMYILPVWYGFRPNQFPSSPTQTAVNLYNNEAKKLETKMQLSFKTKLAQDLFRTRADLWFGYTQVAYWQVYNPSWSSPFRETNYRPEIFITQPVRLNLPGKGLLRMMGIGAIHESNGKSDPLSRSWNRFYLMGGMQWGKLTVLPRLWWRIPEKKDDNNPDITHYMGYSDVQLQYRLKDRQVLGALVRYNTKTAKGGLRLDYTFPIAGKLKGYIQAYSGYGENLLDYNHYHNSIGIGLMFHDWDGF